MGWIDGAEKLPQDADAEDPLLCCLIDEEYTNGPFYGGSRCMVVFLRREGHLVNRKRVQRLMRSMGLSNVELQGGIQTQCR